MPILTFGFFLNLHQGFSNKFEGPSLHLLFYVILLPLLLFPPLQSREKQVAIKYRIFASKYLKSFFSFLVNIQGEEKKRTVTQVLLFELPLLT